MLNENIVLTSHPLARQAGQKMLEKGGNAIDAAVASALALMVVEPTSTGLGGDSFALVWANENLYGLNASGYSPQGISINNLKSRGFKEVPEYGMIPVTVPGGLSGLVALSERFGKLNFKDLFEPALKLAREGYLVTPIVAKLWEKSFNLYCEKLKGEEFNEWFKTFTRNGKAPKVGDLWISNDLADSLELIAKTKGQALYQGEIGDKIDKFSKKNGGYLRKSDMETYKPEWVEPINVEYRDYNIWEIPPNGQGIVSLMALNILNNMDINKFDELKALHTSIEAIKLSFADAKAYISDMDFMSYKVDELLSDEYAKSRGKLIKEFASNPTCGNPRESETVYVATSDTMGNMVSLMQSHFMGFGSGIVVPGTGIPLHNRGRGFSLDKSHPNALGPNKRPYHTIIPSFITKVGRPVGPLGIVGGLMQPQGQVQLLLNLIDNKKSPQEALDKYRWQWIKGKVIQVERGFPKRLINGLIEKGHIVEIQDDLTTMGRGQIIWKDNDKIQCGRDKRAD